MQKKKSTNSWQRSAVSLLFSFFLSLALLGMTLLLTIQFSCFSEEQYYRCMDDSYYIDVLNTIQTAAEDYTLPTGLDLSVLDDVFYLSEVREDVNTYVYTTFAHQDYTPNTQEIEARLTENVTAFFETNEVQPDEEETQDIQQYVDTVTNYYVTYTKNPMLELTMQAQSLFGRIFLPALAGLSVLIVVLGFLLFRLHPWPHQGVRYWVYATEGTVLMTAVLPALALLFGAYRRIQVSPSYFYSFTVNYLEGLLKGMLLAAGGVLLLAIVLTVLVNYLKGHYAREV